jgi:hypothetical protein
LSTFYYPNCPSPGIVARIIFILRWRFSFEQLAPNSKTGNSQEVEPLEQDKPITRELAISKIHTYQLTLAEGDFLRIAIEQHGIDVAVRLIGPDGNQISETNAELRKQGEEVVSQVADTRR